MAISRKRKKMQITHKGIQRFINTLDNHEGDLADSGRYMKKSTK